MPVYDEKRGPEAIVGVVYSKDLSRLMFFRREPQRTAGQPATPFVELRLSQVMRDVLVVPETKSALDLLREFQKRRKHIAIVVDEYGSTVGLVTAEDAIEQLTGEIEDEFDDPQRPLITNAGGMLLLDGSVNLRDLETQMQWKLPREGGVETLAGFLLARLGHIPRPGEHTDYEARRFTVVEMDGRRIGKVRVEPIQEASSHWQKKLLVELRVLAPETIQASRRRIIEGRRGRRLLCRKRGQDLDALFQARDGLAIMGNYFAGFPVSGQLSHPLLVCADQLIQQRCGVPVLFFDLGFALLRFDQLRMELLPPRLERVRHDNQRLPACARQIEANGDDNGGEQGRSNDQLLHGSIRFSVYR